MPDDWSRYWRSADMPLEAMYAHFERHVYHRHSHEGYSFGVTEDGAQSFRCRGAGHTSVTGMVMAFNPDDPLFTQPVLTDSALARNLSALHRALLGGATALRRDELLAAVVGSMARRAAVRPIVSSGDGPPTWTGTAGAAVARRAREVIDATAGDDITTAQLAEVAGCSRFALHRAFSAAYLMTPGDYQRLVRLRSARRLIAQGWSIGDAAADAGFADQSHLTRWFRRYYGITPGGYQHAVAAAEPAAVTRRYAASR
jgi:AraC-like DNA-binding protein